MSEQPTRKSGYLPGLDGLRAIAILGVLTTHDLPWVVFGHSNAAWKGYGGWGVQLFFAISGVLICWRLLEDEAKQGGLRIGAFYTRRIFRIQPAALAYLLVVALLFAFQVIAANWLYWTSAALTFTNFLVTSSTPPGAAAFVGHFWTLSVEEHFYIVLSLLFLLARKHRVLCLGLLVGALIVGQQVAEAYGLFTPVVSDRRSYWVIQLLLVPALLSLCVHPHRVRTLVVRYLRPWVVYLCLAMSLAGDVFQHGVASAFRYWDFNLFMNNISSIVFYGFGFVVIAVMLHPASWTTRLLELKPLRFVGRISYSLYLWHVLFFLPIYLPGQVHSPTLLLLCGRPWKYIGAGACALLSYYFIERPLIRVGHKLAPPAAEGHLDMQGGEAATG